MPLLASFRRRREAVHATMRKTPDTTWQRDLAQATILLALLALVISVRAWWAVQNTGVPALPN
ncbi:hypothetical protein [Bosea sp. BH3]|uniref:hypothetical protein n=1 Tax=Bosea sp. BH3 TaxID=2871701 RepID=UPI0021CB0462|nr:hypothetical protein [Bosea sp. BH3]MCU4181087.1 hypothetical protein [Bosea sp. BH3]